jgi:predicted YcjX-like family ATPase
VLVDALAALNAGPEALRDLETALTQILGCFRTGRSNFVSALFRPRIDRILFAATKADHLHHTSHDRLEDILARMTERAIERAKFSGALIDVIALAAVRATREATVEWEREQLPSIMGAPLAGETIEGRTFDGMAETAVFPGDLPERAADLFAEGGEGADLRFLRFRPPALAGDVPTLPHIRLDRALQFLLGDRLR